MKKGQVSMFIILGLVILAAFAFVLYVASVATTSKLESQRQQTIASVLEAQAVDVYTNICAENALKEGLILIGKQGGYIYQGQYGGYFTPETINYFGNRTTFLIKPALDWQPVPDYPCFPGAGSFPRYCKYPFVDSGYYLFGRSMLPDLTSGIGVQLAAYINGALRNCTDFESFLEEEGLSGYEVEEGEPETAIIFTSESVIARIKYPLKIKIGNREPVIEVFNFDAEVKVRFSDLYNAVNDVVEKEVNDLNYNLSDKTFLGRQGLTAVDYQVYHFLDGDVAVLTDYWSTIEGQNYTFIFARQNRPPVVDYVFKNESNHDLYDYLIIEGQTLTLAATGGDPDEQNVSFWFEGDLGLVQGPGLSRQINLSNYYNITLNVSDGQLQDYQLVRVLVDPKLKANFTTFNLYDDIDNNKFSLEDPFYLNASPTMKTLDDYASYKFIWYVGGNFETETITEPCISIPNVKNCSDKTFDILNIKNRVFNSDQIGIGFIEMAAEIEYDNFKQPYNTILKNISIFQCLPHRSNDSIYPYNTGDPFLANHSCCGDDYRIAETDQVCHAVENYFCVNKTIIWSNSTPRYCDGLRGNICNGSFGETFLENKGICGREDVAGCAEKSWLGNGYDPNCEGVNAYQIRLGQGWCYGDYGCHNFCTDEVVAPGYQPGINQILILDNSYTCGCNSSTLNKWCDKDHDGWFTGRCNNQGDCVCTTNSCTET